jgi:hypothetical protein
MRQAMSAFQRSRNLQQLRAIAARIHSSVAGEQVLGIQAQPRKADQT